ncbi:MAG: secretin and TonB N-terminal domain-containing protein [Caulobacteraceae bacterium]|nr:secretin and TonB N-terminal domain-containing protein [Caulobacteraceae bacterium]
MTRPNRSRRLKALALSCAAIALTAAQAHAQTQADVNRRTTFDIPAEDLGQAITQAAQQSGREIIFSADLVRGKRTAGVHGAMSLDTALDRLLAGAGIGRHISKDGAIILDPGASAQAYADQPESIVVTAQKRSELLIKVPISAMAISQDRLDRQGATDIADLARLSPGLYLQGSHDSGDV